jgi:FtsP/CotA-like multicopper oxidase with cupredoxin domain
MRKSLLGLVSLAALLNASATFAAERSITLVNIEYEGTKVWVPGTIVVQKGDTVKIKLINNVTSDPNQHGFSIAEFKVGAVVDRGEPKTIEFVADKAGIFATTCQLHPAHIGGQLVVLDK